MDLVACSDFIESDGATYNTAFLLGRDVLNHQRDMRVELFGERNPEAFGIPTETNLWFLTIIPIVFPQKEAGRIAARVFTIGEEEP